MAAALLLTSGVLKVWDPTPNALLEELPRWAGILEVVVGLGILWRPTRRLAASTLIAMVCAYTILILVLACLDLPVTACGCFGSRIRAGLGAHLMILGVLGVLAVGAMHRSEYPVHG